MASGYVPIEFRNGTVLSNGQTTMGSTQPGGYIDNGSYVGNIPNVGNTGQSGYSNGSSITVGGKTVQGVGSGDWSDRSRNISNSLQSNPYASQINLTNSGKDYLSDNDVVALNGLIPRPGVGGVGKIGMSQSDQDLIAEAQRVWNLPVTTQAQKDELHNYVNTIRDKNGLSGQYDKATGVLYPGATGKAANYDSIDYTIPSAKEYDVPMPTAPNLTIQPFTFDDTLYKSIDPGMTWLPTLNTKKAWYDQENQRVGNLQNGYTNSLSAWKAGADQFNTEQQREQSLLLSILPYRYQTADQSAADAYNKSKLDWDKDPTNPANILDLAQSGYYNTKGTSGGSSGGGKTPTVTVNPFDNPGGGGVDNSKKINGYDVSRIDTYISKLRQRSGGDANKTYQAAQNAKGLNPNFKIAVLRRIETLTTAV